MKTDTSTNYYYGSLPVYDSYCAVCGTTQLQTVPDDVKTRGVCYECYQIAWGKTPTRIDLLKTQISSNLTEMNTSEGQDRKERGR